MIYRQILLVAGLCVALQISSAAADQDRGFTTFDKQPEEYDSCDLVNRAYERTVNTGTYLLKINRVDEGAPMSLHVESLATGNAIYTRYPPGDWKRYRRPVLGPVDKTIPDFPYAILRSCNLIGEDHVSGNAAQRFTATWKRRRALAYINVWISKESGKFIQLTREFDPQHDLPFGFLKTFETYDYRTESFESLRETLERTSDVP